jgi:anti-anti-sigma regulatory factor
MAYTLEHDPIDSGHLIVITGELDIAATPELSTVLLMAASSPDRSWSWTSSGWSSSTRPRVARCSRRAPRSSRPASRLRVVCASGPVRRLLEMTNLTKRFELCPSRDDALDGASTGAG